MCETCDFYILNLDDLEFDDDKKIKREHDKDGSQHTRENCWGDRTTVFNRKGLLYTFDEDNKKRYQEAITKKHADENFFVEKGLLEDYIEGLNMFIDELETLRDDCGKDNVARVQSFFYKHG